MTKKTIITLFIAILAAAGGFFFALRGKTVQDSTPLNTPNPTTTTTDPSVKTYPMSEVGKHDFKEDCWIVIHDNIYNVTAFVTSHPGGDAILEGCGKDATQLYETRPMGSGTAHSQTARSLLEQYYVGKIQK